MYNRNSSSYRRHRYNRHHFEAIIGYVLFAAVFMFLLANILSSPL